MKKQLAFGLAALLAVSSLTACNNESPTESELREQIAQLESELDKAQGNSDNMNNNENSSINFDTSSVTQSSEPENSDTEYYDTPPPSDTGNSDSEGSEPTQPEYDDGIDWNSISEAPASDFKYETDFFGNVKITEYFGKATIVKIPSTIDGKSVNYIGDKAFSRYYDITDVSLPDTVTTIGDEAFNSCYRLNSITIPNSVTKIGRAAFSDCSGLTNITIPDSVIEIQKGAFYGCTSLTSITIPNSLTELQYITFGNCTALTNVTIPDSVTFIRDNTFRDCENIKATYKGKTYTYDQIEDLYSAINGN